MAAHDYPLDLRQLSYAYIERPNRSLLLLLERFVLQTNEAPAILDVGCGCGANAAEIRRLHPRSRIIGIEPNADAAGMAAGVCDDVFPGTLEKWLAANSGCEAVHAVLLSDVLEHIADPVSWLQSMAARKELRGAVWIISVPNVAVWYHRIRTLFGVFRYGWSGLYDRTHLRFYTRSSFCELLRYCGFEVLAGRATASLVQSLAPLIRRRFQPAVASHDHLALTRNPLFRFYRRFVEPAEEAFCNLLPGLLGFQIVVAARLTPSQERGGDAAPPSVAWPASGSRE